MGYVNFYNMIRINNYKEVRYLQGIIKPIDIVCKECQLGKKTRISFKNKEYSMLHPLEIIHTDLCGPKGHMDSIVKEILC